MLQQRHLQHLCVSGEVWLFAISLQNLHGCLVGEYRRRLSHKVSYFRKLSCFDVYTDSQLGKLVESRPEVIRKRDDVLFREGDPGEGLYLLADG